MIVFWMRKERKKENDIQMDWKDNWNEKDQILE